VTDAKQDVTLALHPAAQDDTLRKDRRLFWLAAIVIAALQVWSHRNDLSPDGISYIELARTSIAFGLPGLVNAYWSPLYPFLISITLRLLHPSMQWEFAAVHLVNFFIYLASFAAFQIFLKELLHFRALQEKIDVSFTPLSPRHTQILASILFLWAAQFWLSPSIVNPDLTVAALVYLASALLIRITRTGASGPTWILLGVILGFAYLAKTAMFPLGFVFLACAFLLARRKHPRAVRTYAGAALALLIFFAIAAPWISAISHAKHRWTFGDSGRIAYAEYVNKATLTTHWQGQPPGTGRPLHPTRQISADPPIFEFAQPIPGSYPPWYDPSYWYDGIHPHFSLRGQLWVLFRALNMYFKMFSKTGVLYVVLLVFVIAGKRHGRLQKVSPEMWLVIVPSIAALFMYALVLVELRYVSPFALLLLVSTIARAESLPTSAASFATQQKFSRCAILAAIVAPGLAIAWPIIRDARTAIRDAPYEDWQVAIALPGFGVRPGSGLAYIGSGGDAYWAHLAGDRLIAEIPGKDQSALLTATPEKRLSILQDLVRLGADGVVTKNAAVAHSTRDWERIGNTQYYIWRFTQFERPSVLWRPRRADDEAYVVGPEHRGVPRICAAAIASDINLAIVVANVFRWVFYRVERISLPVLPRLRTKCCVRAIQSGAVERLYTQSKVLLPQEVARIVSRLKGDA
jgi:hypothetical protein